MRARSPLGIIANLATTVEVPEKDDGAAFLVDSPDYALMRIHSAPQKGRRAFVEVSYRGGTYWLDDADLRSKRTLTFLNLLFNFVETGSKPAPTLVTIPG